MTRRIGLVGCGRWGGNILRDLLRLECEVHVQDPDPAAHERALARGAASASAELVEPERMDGFVVASPTVTHYEVVRALLPLSKPVFCEKPLAPDADAARCLAEAPGGPLYVMDKWRYHPIVRALADLARSGELGRVQLVRTRRTQWGQPHLDVDGVWILAPHDLSIVLEILGHLPEPVLAVCDRSGPRMDGLIAVLGRGPRAVIEVSSREPCSARAITVSFERGVAWMADPLADHICVHRGDPGPVIDPAAHDTIPVSAEWPLFLELRHFIEHLDGGPPPLSDAAGAVKQVEMIERLRTMAST